jgi:phosphatidate cytidylyltransferase
MLQRMISGLIITAIFVPPVFINDKRYLMAVGFVVVLIALEEYRRIIKTPGVFFLLTPLIYISIILLAYQFPLWLNWIYLVLVVLFLILSFVAVVKDSKINTITHYLFLLLGLGIGSGSIVYSDIVSFTLLVYLALIVSFTDIFAFFFGIKFGKHKLAPSISPKKSWEGSFFGTLLGSATGILFVLVTNVPILGNYSLLRLIILSFSISIFAQIGDLFASKIKRSVNVKDFGSLFPGHGGILDRFDSLLMAGLVMAIVMLWG